MKRAVFLDRDGVLNQALVRGGVPHPPDSAETVEILPGVTEALELLGSLGLARIVVTNQPDIARGAQSAEEVERINRRLCDRLPIDAVYVCPHDNADRCRCRKPLPGLLERASAELGIDLSASFMVGDRWSDVAAGQAARCRSVLIDRPYSDRARCRPDAFAADLLAAARWIAEAMAGAGRE